MTIEYELLRFLVRGGTTTNLQAVNEIPLVRELVVDRSTGRLKLGDGATPYNDLPFMGGIAGLPYAADDSGLTSDADPGPGLARWNHAAQSAATALYVSDETRDAAGLAALWAALQPGGLMYLQREGFDTAWQLWRVDSIVAADGYVKLGGSVLASVGTFGALDALRILIQQGSSAGGGVGSTEVLSVSGDFALDAATHKNKLLLHAGGVVTLPETEAAGFAINDIVEVRKQTAAPVTFVPASGSVTLDYNDTLFSAEILNQKDMVGLKVSAVDTWLLVGALADA